MDDFHLDFKPVKRIRDLLCVVKFHKTNKKVAYGEVACSFDIETTSFYRNILDTSITTIKPDDEEYDLYEKCSIMYAFVLGINGKCIIGRTWDEFKHYIKVIKRYYGLNSNRRLIFFIHNFSFEMQYLRKIMEWDKIFSIELRKPLYALSKEGIEFRCSYLLTNYGLAKVGEHLLKYKVEKKVGDLDYTKLRHSKTKLTATEIGYMVNDGLVVMAHIQEEIERLKSITYIPFTATGYVRNYCRTEALYNGDKTHRKTFKAWQYYKRLMECLTLEEREYEMLELAFAGGFTHASCNYSGMAVENVASFDFSSAYPAVMVMEKFPMSKGKFVNVGSYEEFMRYIDCYCCVFFVTFKNIKSKIQFEHYISYSKCTECENPVIDNGRVVSADKLTICITDVDYQIIRRVYSWEDFGVSEFIIYQRGYLPTSFVYSILQLYKKKTELKGVKGMEAEYNHSKSDLNATFGMCVTKVIRKEAKYDTDTNEWIEEEGDKQKQLSHYNKSRSRFLFFPWGVFITAYNRANLWSGILNAGDNYCYSDTDSIKVRNREALMPYINKYNAIVKEKLQEVCEHHGFPFYMVCPKTKEGKEKMIGAWDYEGTYSIFKSLGAKRYMIEEDGEINITVSGVSKVHAVPYIMRLSEETKRSPFDLFEENLVIPADYTGKMIHSYIDYPIEGELEDYQGRIYNYHEESGVHLEKTSYNMSIASSYLHYLLSIRSEVKYG